jgi:hypothetical protein
MSATITWSIDQLKTVNSPVTGFVCHVTYRVKAEQDGWVIEYLGHVPFEAPSETITPYGELTEAQVLNWVKSDPLVQADKLESHLQEQMDYHFNPPVVPLPTPLPWSKE